MKEKPAIAALGRTSAAIAAATKALAGRGRVFVRYSGTEPLMRILVEGPGRPEVHRIAEGLARSFLDNISRRHPTCP